MKTNEETRLNFLVTDFIYWELHFLYSDSSKRSDNGMFAVNYLSFGGLTLVIFSTREKGKCRGYIQWYEPNHFCSKTTAHAHPLFLLCVWLVNKSLHGFEIFNNGKLQFFWSNNLCRSDKNKFIKLNSLPFMGFILVVAEPELRKKSERSIQKHIFRDDP